VVVVIQALELVASRMALRLTHASAALPRLLPAHLPEAQVVVSPLPQWPAALAWWLQRAFWPHAGQLFRLHVPEGCASVVRPETCRLRLLWGMTWCLPLALQLVGLAVVDPSGVP
jgi:hypothetical protein